MKWFCMVLVLCTACVVSGNDNAEIVYHHAEAGIPYHREANEELADTHFKFHLKKPKIDMNIYADSNDLVDLKEILRGLLAGKLDRKDLLIDLEQLLRNINLKELLKNRDLKRLLKKLLGEGRNLDLKRLLKKVLGIGRRDQMRRKDALKQEEDFKFEIDKAKIGMNIYTGSKDKFNYKKIVKQLIKKLGSKGAKKVLKKLLMNFKGKPKPTGPGMTGPGMTSPGITGPGMTGPGMTAPPPPSPPPPPPPPAGDYFDELLDYFENLH